MKIQKKFQGTVPENKILNTHSDSETDTYSCNKINELVGSGGSGEISIDGDITTNNNTRLKEKNYNVITINHRGYNTIAPENTLPAYIMSKEKGYNYVECDVSFTSDGIPVLLHDDTIDRTSNGSGSVSNLTYEQLLQYDFGSWKSSEYTGTKIPTFEEFIVLCKNIGLYPYIELKSNGNYTREQIVEIVNIVKKCGMQGNVTYISFNIDYLEYVNSVDKQARIGYLLWEINETEINKVIKLSSGINEVFIDAPYTNLANTGIELCIKNNIPLEIWSVNDENIIKNMNSYISGVTSDNLIVGQILSSSNGVEIIEVPEHVKKITKLDIAKWNSASGDGSSLEIYSTEEIVIGTWIDLKPIYRKVCSFNPPNFYNGLAEVVTNVLNCDVMITQKLFWFDSAAKVWRTFPGNYYATNDWDTQNSFAPQTGGIRMEAGTNAVTRIKEKATSIYAILEYTKTTD
jgi:glycerophosphoryl diester phosphodiesterase